MTTILELSTHDIEDNPFLTPRQVVERVTAAVQEHKCGAFIYDELYPLPYYGPDRVGSAVAAVIPVSLASELIKEGRLKWPLYTSMTVPAPIVVPDKEE